MRKNTNSEKTNIQVSIGKIFAFFVMDAERPRLHSYTGA